MKCNFQNKLTDYNIFAIIQPFRKYKNLINSELKSNQSMDIKTHSHTRIIKDEEKLKRIRNEF